MPENRYRGQGDKQKSRGTGRQGAGGQRNRGLEDRGTGSREQRDRRQKGRVQEDRGTGAGDKGDRWYVEGSRPREQGIWLSQHQTQNSVARNIAKFII